MYDMVNKLSKEHSIVCNGSYLIELSLGDKIMQHGRTIYLVE